MCGAYMRVVIVCVFSSPHLLLEAFSEVDAEARNAWGASMRQPENARELSQARKERERES